MEKDSKRKKDKNREKNIVHKIKLITKASIKFKTFHLNVSMQKRKYIGKSAEET